MQRIYTLRIPILLIATLIVVVYLMKMMPNGVGVSIDSVNYIAAMRSFLAGHDFLHWDGALFVHWPPLFPAFLAPFGWITSVLNLDFMKVIALVNALLFGLIFFLSGLFFFENLHNKLLALIAVIALVNFPLLFVQVYVFAEPLFIVLVLLFTLALTRLAKTQDKRWLIGLWIFTGLASLQRYIGVFLVPTGAVAVLVFLRSEPIKRRLLYAVAFGLFASLPIGIVMVRNAMATGAVSGDFGSPQLTMAENLRDGAETLVGWFTSQSFEHVLFSEEAREGIVAVCVLLVIALLIRVRRSHSASVIALQTVCLVLAGYCSVLLGLSLRYDFDPPSNRFLAPVYVHVIFIAAFAVDFLLEALRPRLRLILRRSATAAVLVAATLWVISFPLYRSVNELYRVLAPTCCMDPTWYSLPVMEWLRSHPISEPTLSNTPLPLYYSNTQAAEVPYSVSEWSNPALAAHYHILIWMNFDSFKSYTYTFNDLAAVVKLTPVVQFSDGGVYLIGTPGD